MHTNKKSQLIAIMGTPVSSGNRGVLALSTSLVQLCLHTNRNARAVLMVGNKDSEPVSMRIQKRDYAVPVVNYRLSPQSSLCDHLLWILAMSILYRLVPYTKLRGIIIDSTPWIKCIAGSTIVGDIRGGDSFSDIYGLKRFVLGFLPVWTVLLIKGNIVLFPQTYGPFKSLTARFLARVIFRRASVIIARDEESLQLAKKYANPSKRLLKCPDVAFAMEPEAPKRLAFYPPTTENKIRADTIGININGLLYSGGYNRKNMFGLKLDYPVFLEHIICALVNQSSGGMVLIPHTYAPKNSVESDNDACRRTYEMIPKEVRTQTRILSSEYNPLELKGIIGMCDFFIGSRMHSCIAALSQGVPCIGVAYSRKFRGVFDTVGMAEWVVDARKVDTVNAVKRIVDLYQQRNAIREDLQSRADAARKKLTIVFQQLMSNNIKKK